MGKAPRVTPAKADLGKGNKAKPVKASAVKSNKAKIKAAAKGGFSKSRKEKTGAAFAVFMGLLALIVTAGCVVTGPHVLSGYAVVVGEPAQRKFKAPRQIVNEVATEKLRQAARDAVGTKFNLDITVSEDAVSGLFALFDMFGDAREANKPYINADGVYTEPTVYVPDTPSGFSLTDEQTRLLTTIGDGDFNRLVAATTDAVEAAYTGNILAVDVDKARREAIGQIQNSVYNNGALSIAQTLITDSIKPNLIVDEISTESMRVEAADAVEPIVLVAGQSIVDEGEIVSDDIYAILDALGYVSGDISTKLITIIGLCAVSLLLMLPIGAYIGFFRPGIIKNKKEMLLLFTLYASSLLLMRAMIGLPTYYFLPVALFAALVAILIDETLAAICTVFLALVAALVLDADARFLVYFIINGVFAASVARSALNRNRMLTVALAMSLLNAATVAALAYLFDKGYSRDMLYMMVYAFLDGMLTIMLTLGSMPLWESAFGIVTPFRLMYLTSPNSPVLRKLITEAPGTYQHSLVVANLAETAAYEIGANQTLARVGSYYHDIGKMSYPRYFSENQLGENPHDHLTPQESVDVIIGHVEHGLKLAEEYRLPAIIRDFIEQHHGNTLVKYFYYRAYELALGEMPNPERFRYPHRKPQSRETAIVMLADTVEAAIRSMMPSVKSFDEIEETIAGLIKEKLDDGQLIDSGLIIKDLDTIARAFITVFKGVNHNRVVYPKAPKELAESNE